jgi:hypothetical protein
MWVHQNIANISNMGLKVQRAWKMVVRAPLHPPPTPLVAIQNIKIMEISIFALKH